MRLRETRRSSRGEEIGREGSAQWVVMFLLFKETVLLVNRGGNQSRRGREFQRRTRRRASEKERERRRLARDSLARLLFPRVSRPRWDALQIAQVGDV